MCRYASTDGACKAHAAAQCPSIRCSHVSHTNYYRQQRWTLHGMVPFVCTATALYISRHCRRLALEQAANPDNYLMELQFIRHFTLVYQKNYQLWRHRECIVEKIGSAMDELEHLTFRGQSEESDDVSNDIDAKNYHAWQYRQWLVQRFSLSLDAELSATGHPPLHRCTQQLCLESQTIHTVYEQELRHGIRSDFP